MSDSSTQGLPPSTLHDPFLGTWELDPSTLNYESGRPGRRATYLVESGPDGLIFHLDADDADGRPMKVQYGGPTDGSAQPLPGNPGLFLVLKRDNERSLDSILVRDGIVLDHWRREVAADGQSMKITQFVTNPNGGHFQNTGIYRRVR